MSTQEVYDFVDKYFYLKTYLYSMTVYHIIAILFFIYEIKGFHLQTFVGVDQSLISKSAGLLEILETGKGLISNLIIISIILGIDLVFLLILSYDFRNLNLTWNKIYIIEFIIFTIALLLPTFRAIMMFFSLNTLQLFVIYHFGKVFDGYDIKIIGNIISLGGYFMAGKIIYYGLTYAR